ncbi:MAG: hypothetical protein AB8H79_08160 [Myxococcota bacterium]
MSALKKAAQKCIESEPSAEWDDLARGKLSKDEADALADQPDGDALSDLFAPLGDDFVDGVLGDVLGMAGAEPDDTTEEDAKATTSQNSAPPANNRRWLFMAAPVVAAIAAVLLFMAWPNPDALPNYTFEVTGGDQPIRGTPSAPVGEIRTLSVGSKLTITARPPTAVTGPVGATLVVRENGTLRAASAGIAVSESGAAKWTGIAGQPPLTADVSNVMLVIHPAGFTDAQVLASAESRDEDLVIDVPVRVRAP